MEDSSAASLVMACERPPSTTVRVHQGRAWMPVCTGMTWLTGPWLNHLK
jgi:hypothetical protein